MNEYFKKIWVKALRSGKYKQTTTKLRDTFGFCCLGVACDLFKEKHQKNGRNPILYIILKMKKIIHIINTLSLEV